MSDNIRKTLKISGVGIGGMGVEDVNGGTKVLCDMFSIGFSSIIAGDTILMTFDGPELMVNTLMQAQALTAADFEMKAEEIYEN